MKKKFLSILIALFVCTSLFATVLGDSVQKGKVSIGASFGTSGSSEKSIHTDDATLAVKSGNVGYVARVRFDVMYSEKQSATIMASFDKPSKTVLVRSDELNEEEFVNPMYVRLFVGASEHSVSSSNLVIAVGVGVEGFYDLNAKVFGVGPASYIRTSYQIPGTHFTFDATAKGDATVVNLFDKNAGRHLYLEGDVSLGFSYYF
jgi:hypothetical protein